MPSSGEGTRTGSAFRYPRSPETYQVPTINSCILLIRIKSNITHQLCLGHIGNTQMARLRSFRSSCVPKIHLQHCPGREVQAAQCSKPHAQWQMLYLHCKALYKPVPVQNWNLRKTTMQSVSLLHHQHQKACWSDLQKEIWSLKTYAADLMLPRINSKSDMPQVCQTKLQPWSSSIN